PRMETNPCFTSHGKWEIGTKDGRKLVGSAQARSRGIFLEHGSILLENDQLKILDYLPEGISPKLMEVLRDNLSNGIASLREFRPGLTPEEMEEALHCSFSSALGADLERFPHEGLHGSRLRELVKDCMNDL
ncbi:MAG: lipoate--protein ligase family protein, partial [Candidatus Fermentibacteraceae bacterium]|nr:lipoate--protein ligase family protein [Candidatus Fermentibacteraceae bacterium]